MKGHEKRGVTSTISSSISKRTSDLFASLLFTNWLSTFVNSVIPFAMKSPEERERIQAETWTRGLEATRMTWITRATLKAGGHAYLPKDMYKIVKRRLSRSLSKEELSNLHAI
jgi:hypothetical protein